MKRICSIFITILIMVTFVSCTKTGKEVVIYTSVDRIYSEPILDAFEEETGIKVLAVYDVEAAKTTGLVNRLISEKENPKADVFWNGEIMYSLMLKEEGVFEAYDSPNNVNLPEQFVDADYNWTAFGGRARVFIVNTELLAEADYPKSIEDFLDDDIAPSQKAIAKPLFGTTATQAAALFALKGDAYGVDFFKQLMEVGVQVVDGNGAVRDLVASGQLVYGLTDTDDALAALNQGAPVAIIFPDQEKDGIGTLVIPNSVGIIKGAPNGNEAEIFVDYILSDDTMKALIESGWCQVTTRDIAVEQPIDVSGLQLMNVTFEEIGKKAEETMNALKAIFVN